jgi:hypothetical protein
MVSCATISCAHSCTLRANRKSTKHEHQTIGCRDSLLVFRKTVAYYPPCVYIAVRNSERVLIKTGGSHLLLRLEEFAQHVLQSVLR